MIAAFLGHRVTRSLENYGYARSGKGGPKVAGVEHSNAIKSNTRRYKSKTTPGGGNPSPTRKRALKWVLEVCLGLGNGAGYSLLKKVGTGKN